MDGLTNIAIRTATRRCHDRASATCSRRSQQCCTAARRRHCAGPRRPRVSGAHRLRVVCFWVMADRLRASACVFARNPVANAGHPPPPRTPAGAMPRRARPRFTGLLRRVQVLPHEAHPRLRRAPWPNLLAFSLSLSGMAFGYMYKCDPPERWILRGVRADSSRAEAVSHQRGRSVLGLRLPGSLRLQHHRALHADTA
jgi:hypothetical protein